MNEWMVQDGTSGGNSVEKNQYYSKQCSPTEIQREQHMWF